MCACECAFVCAYVWWGLDAHPRVTCVSVSRVMRVHACMVPSNTVRHREIGTGISEASKKVPIFLHDVRGGKQVSSYFGQELSQGQELRQVGLNRLRFGSLLHDLSLKG
jgi:hypothetical protein